MYHLLKKYLNYQLQFGQAEAAVRSNDKKLSVKEYLKLLALDDKIDGSSMITSCALAIEF